MRAYTEYREIWKRRILLSSENEKKIMERYGIAASTLHNCLHLDDPNNTRPKTLQIQVDAINEFGGVVLSQMVRKKVLVIDDESSPTDFKKEGRLNIFH